MKKQIWLLTVSSIIIVILVGILIFVPAKKTPAPVINGIGITSPKSGEEISLPLKITGVINGNGWAGFEGQVGHVDLVSNGVTIGSAPLEATTEWMSLLTSFKAEISSQIECLVAPCYQPGDATLVFHNENPSDMRDKDRTFSLPVIIK